MSSRQISTTWRISSCTSVTAHSRWSLPPRMRDRSRRSSIKRASRATLRRIISSTVRKAAGVAGSSSIAVAVARMGVSGVRSSWLRAARKRSLARLAASASARPARSRSISASASARRRLLAEHTLPLLLGPLPLGDLAEDQDPTGRDGRLRRGADPRVEGRTRRRSRPLELEARIPAPIEPLQPIGQRRPRGEHPRRLDGQDIPRRPSDQPMGGRIARDDPTRRVDDDDWIVDPLDDRGPRDRRQVQQPESRQAGDERQPGHGEACSGQIDVENSEHMRHVNGADDPGHQHAEEHHGGLGAVHPGGTDDRLGEQQHGHCNQNVGISEFQPESRPISADRHLEAVRRGPTGSTTRRPGARDWSRTRRPGPAAGRRSHRIGGSRASAPGGYSGGRRPACPGPRSPHPRRAGRCRGSGGGKT